MKYIVLIAALILFAFPHNIYAMGNSFYVTGGNQVGESMTINASVGTGEANSCNDQSPIVEIVMNAWGGTPQGFAIDFSGASITANVNGQLLGGSIIYKSQAPAANDIILHLSTPFTFHPQTDKVNVTITGAKRSQPAASGLHMWLLTKERGDYPAYFGCGNDAYSLTADSWQQTPASAPTSLKKTTILISTPKLDPTITQPQKTKITMKDTQSKGIKKKENTENVGTQITHLIVYISQKLKEIFK